jgi:hypothetical protein
MLSLVNDSVAIPVDYGVLRHNFGEDYEGVFAKQYSRSFTSRAAEDNMNHEFRGISSGYECSPWVGSQS